MRGRRQGYARLFVDEQQSDYESYTDDLEGLFGGPSGSTTVVARAPAGPAPAVEEGVTGKKDAKGKRGPSPAPSG